MNKTKSNSIMSLERHWTDPEIEAVLDGTLPRELVLLLGIHVSGCEECKSRMENAAQYRCALEDEFKSVAAIAPENGILAEAHLDMTAGNQFDADLLRAKSSDTLVVTTEEADLQNVVASCQIGRQMVTDLKLSAGTSPSHTSVPTLLELISTDITELFVFRAELKAASGEDGIKRKLADGRTQIAVHSDSAGRLWLRITSTAEEFRNGTFKLDIEPAPSVLTFTEVEPGLYSARVCVDEDVATELAKGAVPKLTQLPTPEG